MAGRLCENEEGCAFFKTLQEKNKHFNRFARQVAEEGGEFPGSVSSLYG